MGNSEIERFSRLCPREQLENRLPKDVKMELLTMVLGSEWNVIGHREGMLSVLPGMKWDLLVTLSQDEKIDNWLA